FMLVALGTFIATVFSTSIFAVPKLLTAFGILELRDIASALKSSAKVNRSELGTGLSIQPSTTVLKSRLSNAGTPTSKASGSGNSNSSEQKV
ncbi:hypothetical protein HDV00_006849, partial [Rhizophlyctis rosea]